MSYSFSQQYPSRVIIDEAVELAKRYCSLEAKCPGKRCIGSDGNGC